MPAVVMPSSLPRGLAIVGCQMGVMKSWSKPGEVAGGIRPWGDLVVTMPKASRLRHKRKFTLTKTGHKTSISPPNSGSVRQDDVTRSVTVTLTRR